MRTVSFKTLGCKVNQYETQAMREQFIRAGFREVQDGTADVYIINTCTVTAATDSKSRHLIRAAHRSNPGATIVVTGCYVERDKDVVKKIDGVDFLVENSRKDKIVEVVTTGVRSHLPVAIHRPYLPLRISDFLGHTRAFIKVQDGCNRRCSYCKVRIVRGRSRSRDLDDIVEEANRLAEKGFKEVVLSGIQLGSYGAGLEENVGLSDVIEKLEQIDGLRRIRLSSIEPMDIDDRLLEKVASPGKLCRHLHIPLQSGDDEILSWMRRGYRGKDFEALIKKIRGLERDISITTDVMVGFPGEREANFARTLEVVEAILPCRVHIFPYSRREQTEAAKLSDPVPYKVVKERMARLREVACDASFTYRKRFLNRRVDILVETKRDLRTGSLCGYTDTYIKILVEGSDELMNQIVPVRVTQVERDRTFGRVLSHNTLNNNKL